jgi:hypothetical protein
MNDETQITVSRTTSYADSLRSYKINVDGTIVGLIRDSELVTVSVSPGRHSIVLRIDWCGSKRVNFEVQPGEHILFECGSSLKGWRLLLGIFYIIFRPNRYLWLRRTK